jgi:hypothetical protein
MSPGGGFFELCTLMAQDFSFFVCIFMQAEEFIMEDIDFTLLGGLGLLSFYW